MNASPMNTALPQDAMPRRTNLWTGVTTTMRRQSVWVKIELVAVTVLAAHDVLQRSGSAVTHGHRAAATGRHSGELSPTSPQTVQKRDSF